MMTSQAPSQASFAPSSLWARRMASKSISLPKIATTSMPTSLPSPTGSDNQCEEDVNVLSLILEMSLAKLQPMRSPVLEKGLPSPRHRGSEAIERLQASSKQLSVEIETAQTAVRSALNLIMDVDEEDEQPRGLVLAPPQRRLSFASSLPSALASPTTPISPADSNFSITDNEAMDGDAPKRKGRARMSQEKRKRLARRREREALIAAMQSYACGGPAPVLRRPSFSSGPASPALSLGMGWAEVDEDRGLPSPALTIGSASSDSSLSTPQTSPCKSESGSQDLVSSFLRLPTLVIEPPSPQRGGQANKKEEQGYCLFPKTLTYGASQIGHGISIIS